MNRLSIQERVKMSVDEELRQARRTLAKRAEALWTIGFTVAMAVLVSWCTASCASPYPMTWTRAGAGDDALRMEAAQCRVQAMSAAAAERDGYTALALAESIYRDCMIGRGWMSTR